MIQQPDLFEVPQTFTRGGSSIVPPTRDEVARAQRDRAIERAGAHADATSPEWRDRALSLVRDYAMTHAELIGESVREHAESIGFPTPPDKRAWGSVMVRAAKAGYVRKVGWTTASAPNVHKNPVSLWRSLLFP